MRENTVGALRKYVREELEPIYGKEETAAITDLLLEAYTGMHKSVYTVKPETRVLQSVLVNCFRAIKKLKRFVPVQYILGYTEWYGAVYSVSPEVLVPRPETEELADRAIQALQASSASVSVLDIGTGSGCIAIAMKKKLPAATVYALDVSEQALTIAEKNARAHEAEIHFLHLDFLQENNWGKLPDVTAIISNPPYIGRDELYAIEENVKGFEPAIALFSPEEDPLVFYRKIAGWIRQRKNPVEYVFLEINQLYGPQTAAIFKEIPGMEVQLLKDIHGNDRFVTASLASS